MGGSLDRRGEGNDYVNNKQDHTSLNSATSEAITGNIESKE